ncbi:MAG: RagB/SusD family nutrient uptake outer membrane protein, partial [Muribaculaceae bacterium]|nr:RagB/SusD family nutrient uptake outer membrane protein [Muribaculaceae bacterium]
MKTTIKALAAAALLTGLTGCSGDYLDQPPYEQVPEEHLSNTIDMMQAAVNGMCQTMYILWDSDATERYGNGEAYVQSYYGDDPSPDFAYTWLWGTQAQYQPWALMQRDDRAGGSYAWRYSYAIINQANRILEKIDEVEAPQNQRDFIKAQALTMRAHAYIRLMQIYGPRFEDNENGKKLCVILKLETGTQNEPLADYETVVGQIYKDLDDAIALYTSSRGRRSAAFQPDIAVAQGLYSRIALINHDWAKAEQMAHDGRQGFAIMSAEDYKKGFADPTSEWMWYNNRDRSNNGYYSWGASFTCNGGYSSAYTWAGSGGQMSYDLYKQIYDKNNSDVRCELFWMPDKMNKYVDYGLDESVFWNTRYVQSSYMNMWLISPELTESISLWVKHNTPEGFSDAFAIYVYDDEDEAEAGDPNYYNYMFNLLKAYGYQAMVQFGAQIKFWSYVDDLGDCSHSFMRASELLLNEAEAALEQGDEATAQACLEELNNNRMDSYTCTATGDALKEELRLYRRMELWGEGDTWFSFKRWNVTAVRKGWTANDPTSGNFLKGAFQGSYDPSFANGWTYQIPDVETDYNQIINSQLNK